MKPDNWVQMNAADKREMAMRLLNSQRGKLIVGKALAKAIQRHANMPLTLSNQTWRIWKYSGRHYST